MGYRFQHQESVDHGVQRIIGEQIQAGLAELPDERMAPAVRIHQVRKRIKKARAALRLVRPRLGPVYGRENRRLRDASGRLSALRDTEARREALDKLCARFGSRCPADAAVRVGRVLSEVQGEGRAGLSAAGADVAETLHRVQAEQPGATLEGSGFVLLAPGLRRTYKAGGRALVQALERSSVERLHQWRKQVKDHWYHSRLLRPVWPPMMDSYCTALKALSEQLGDDRDLALLRDLLAAEPRRLGGGRALAPLLALIDERRMELQTEAFALGQRIYAERPKAFSRRMRAYWRAWRGSGEQAGWQSATGPHSKAG